MRVHNLSISYGLVEAVRNVSLHLPKGRSLGILGESGCGKSSLAAALAGLSRGKVTGQIEFTGRIGMVFQDPMTALNPTMKVGKQIAEGWLYHKLGKDGRRRALELLHLVGLSPSKIDAYPHHLSGGERQRVVIAIALACNPELIICDEPTTALDSITRQHILSLLFSLKISLIIISHDISVVKACDEIAVMYAGKIVEKGTDLLTSPNHPYTQMLLKSLPQNHKKNEPLQVILGAPPSLAPPPLGCAFKERCPYAFGKCLQEPTGSPACWRAS